MAKVTLAVMGLMLLAMVAFSEATSSQLVQATLKVTNDCKKTDVLVLVVELGNAKPVLCKHLALTNIGPISVDLNLNHLIHLKLSLLNSKKKLVNADVVIDLLNLGHLVQNVEYLLLDLVEDLVENVVKCYLDGKLVLTISVL